MNTKHTPGPWVVTVYPAWEDAQGLHEDVCAYIDADSKRGSVAHVLGEENLSLREANARLIAAAPDLLEALQFLMTASGEQLTTAFEMAQSAIAKATGEHL